MATPQKAHFHMLIFLLFQRRPTQKEFVLHKSSLVQLSSFRQSLRRAQFRAASKLPSTCTSDISASYALCSEVHQLYVLWCWVYLHKTFLPQWSGGGRKVAEMFLVPAIYLAHIEMKLTGKRDPTTTLKILYNHQEISPIKIPQTQRLYQSRSF